jgi:hypothetical protein
LNFIERKVQEGKAVSFFIEIGNGFGVKSGKLWQQFGEF